MARRTIHLPPDEGRYRELEREAGRRGVPIGALLREAINGLAADADRRRDAIGTIRSAEPMELPADPAELRRELAAARDPRA